MSLDWLDGIFLLFDPAFSVEYLNLLCEGIFWTSCGPEASQGWGNHCFSRNLFSYLFWQAKSIGGSDIDKHENQRNKECPSVLVPIHEGIKPLPRPRGRSLLCIPLRNGDLCHHWPLIVLSVLFSTSVYPDLLGPPEFHRLVPVISVSALFIDSVTQQVHICAVQG